MELPGFGYKMKEFLGILMGEFLGYRIRILGKTKDVISKDPKTKAKCVVGNVMELEYNKVKMLCQSTTEKDYLEIQLAPMKKDVEKGIEISPEFMDLVNNALKTAREKMIKKANKKDTDFEEIVLTKLTAITVGAGGGAKALVCQNCSAALPSSRSGQVVCPYCNTTNVF